MTSPSTSVAPDQLAEAIARRRTFAIISHPDAGKTTLTEKLLLYGGAIHMAGAVKARRASRHATSDWMALEQERGISVTSSVMQFQYSGYDINLLDTPGHQDFSEDTYRTLVAADSAVMLLDTDGRQINTLIRDNEAWADVDVVALPLRRPEDYGFRESGLSRWLHRRWLYNMPRSLTTEVCSDWYPFGLGIAMKSLMRPGIGDHV